MRVAYAFVGLALSSAGCTGILGSFDVASDTLGDGADASRDGASSSTDGSSVTKDGSQSATDSGGASDGNNIQASDGSPGGTTCTVSAGNQQNGCVAGQVCIVADCAAKTTGSCQPIDPNGADFNPVCGCDGINYWNTAIAASAGTAAKAGQCTAGTAKQCTGTEGSYTCPGNSTLHCSDEHDPIGGTSACGAAKSSVCWALPPTCPSPVSGGTGVTTCTPDTNGSCTTLCDAIDKQTAFDSATCTLN